MRQLGARPPRDRALLDAISAIEPRQFEGSLWRAVRVGTDPLRATRAGGRWDDGTFDVLYTSTQQDGALAESWYHHSAGQPIPPSRNIARQIHRLRATIDTVLYLSKDDLVGLGIVMSGYGRLSYVERKAEYPTTQQIGEMAFFLEYQAIVVPGARWPASNAVILAEHTRPGQITVESSSDVDLSAWHRTGKSS